MDIEPLWSVGGWFLFFICMATTQSPIPLSNPKSPPSSSSSSSSSYPNFFLFFFIFLFIFLTISPKSLNSKPLNPTAIAISSSISIRRVLLSTETKSTMKVHPKKSKHLRSRSKSKGSDFGSEAHEVPSGPNPISNR
ncbi:CLAVATA3/ESR (CLE)-related protein 41 [Euphorbia peplus]|nr:CLAVATA3/ESR (CLE)-related protein 41 [Euphorbia peplus]